MAMQYKKGGFVFVLLMLLELRKHYFQNNKHTIDILMLDVNKFYFFKIKITIFIDNYVLPVHYRMTNYY
jgi:hypothetical protein